MTESPTALVWILAFLAAFTFVEFVFFASGGLRSRRRARLRRRLSELGLRLHAGEAREEVSLLRREEGREPGRIGALLSRLPGREPLELLLYRAGRPLGTGAFLLLSLGLSVLGLAYGSVLEDARYMFVLPALGLLPLAYVWLRKRRRMRRFDEILPEGLDLLARSLRAGHAVSVGLQMVGDEIPDPVGTEFAQVAEETRFGLDLNLALINLAHRIESPDVPFLATALLIQRETGGNLAEILDNLARIIRERRATYGKISALTAQTRWSANILFAAPVAFLAIMTFFNPDYVEPLYSSPAGNSMLMVAVVMTVVGYALCRRLGVVRV